MANRWGINGNSGRFYFFRLQNHCGPWNLKLLTLWKKSYDKPTQGIKKQRQHFADKGPSSQSYGFSSSHVWMWQLDYKEGWVLKNWCFWTVVLEKPLEGPLDSKEIKPVNSKSTLNIHWTDWCWIWSSNSLATWHKEPTHWKDPDAGKDWGQEEKGATEDKMVGCHHWLKWTWVSASSGRWWRTGKPGVLQSMGSQSPAQLSN